MLEIKSGELYNCPYCGADQQHMQAEDIDPESWSRTVLCLECNRTWAENASVVEVVIPDEHEDAYKIAHPIVIVEKPYRMIFNPQPKPEKGKKK